MQTERTWVGLFAGIFALTASLVWTIILGAIVTATALVNKKIGHFFQKLWGQGVNLLYGIDLRLYYTHRFPKSGGFILAPNHQSIFDGSILVCLPVNFKWVAKTQVRQIPLLGWGMWALGGYFVTRKNSNQDVNVMKNVEDGLRKGDPILIFPEGTRTRDGKFQEKLKKGTFRVALNAGVPVVPMAIEGSFGVAPPRTWPLKRGHHVTVRIGEPLSARPGEDPLSLMERYRKELVRLLEENSAS